MCRYFNFFKQNMLTVFIVIVVVAVVVVAVVVVAFRLKKKTGRLR